MELGLKGKSVIVTGGGSNIGRAIALAYAKEGANVVIAEIDETQGNKVAAEISALGGKSIVVKADVTKFENVEAMVKKAAETFGKVDILVNNVGWDDMVPFKNTTPEFWDKVITLNYRSMINCTKAALAVMIAQKSGNIVNIASDAGRVGEPNESIYSGTKAAVITLSKTIAKECGRYGIRLNTICPGATVPKPEEMGENSAWQKLGKVFTPEVMEGAKKMYPLGRLGTADDIANAVLFISSDAASFVTGQTLSVSGGYSMVG